MSDKVVLTISISKIKGKEYRELGRVKMIIRGINVKIYQVSGKNTHYLFHSYY